MHTHPHMDVHTHMHTHTHTVVPLCSGPSAVQIRAGGSRMQRDDRSIKSDKGSSRGGRKKQEEQEGEKKRNKLQMWEKSTTGQISAYNFN